MATSSVSSVPPLPSGASSAAPAKASPRSLSGLLPFLRPYRGRIALAVFFLVMAAVATLVFPLALRSLIDGGLGAADKGEQLMALRDALLRAVRRGGRAGPFFGRRASTW